jgi:hypothetical protein
MPIYFKAGLKINSVVIQSTLEIHVIVSEITIDKKFKVNPDNH